ncbi:MAG: hypothetical protein U0L83_06835 [Muribaculaceae bacterium]|nr:hypothetical protein [Muribaculaceae bacterium]
MVAAIIVTYHPDIQRLIKNIHAIIDYVDKLIIWRNSNDDVSELTSISSKILVCGNGSNKFLSEPYNRALKWCKKNGYKYLLTMDQDSLWDNLEGFLQTVSISEASDIAIYSPNMNKVELSCDILVDKEFVISSGSLINIDIALKIGGFNEKYKIYWVDSEFCFRARANGYKIVMLPNYNIAHELGKQTKTLFGYTTSNYSPIVYYYMMRNMLWEHREHGNDAVSIKCVIYTTYYNLRGIILGEKDKCHKIAMIVKGWMNGLFSSYKS